MPTGSPAVIAPVVCEMESVSRPARVLDLGMGTGLYGALVRQYLDCGISWQTHLVGVEGWCKYSNPLWDLYNKVHIQRIEKYLAGPLELFDVILLLDVLEHFEKEQGKQVIQDCSVRLKVGGKLMIGTPAVFFEQDAVGGNELERHRCVWTEDELIGLGANVILRGTDPQLAKFPQILAIVSG